MTRRTFASMPLVAAVSFAQEASDPWPKSDLLEAAALAATLRGPAGGHPKILCVAFPVLYRSKHIAHAIFAGPGRSPEGIDLLKKEASGLAKDADIVLYCGCCPMANCPNLRPAYRTMKELGFQRVRVLNIPKNMTEDWYSKDYPWEPGSAATGN